MDMDSEKYINSVTLEYLLNPILYEKISIQNSKEKVICEDLEFYRKRICQITKDMCKGNYINDNLKSVFFNYASTVIYYLKQLDEKDILQSDYLDLNFDISINNSLSSDSSSNFNPDNLIINQPKKNNTLDTFIKKINVESIDKILPQQRIANITNPVLKTKGVKKKIS
uniref:Uncharacterized protein n=1 Tax=viral metagenome TaxID=1070528 RepID=A0A6C0AZ96_9ZZZZ|tara:strand:+ start:638 stop:1144 length:507 start_codon:yes stop_codon:yes gene_type:complete